MSDASDVERDGNFVTNVEGWVQSYRRYRRMLIPQGDRPILVPIYGQSNALCGGARDLPSADRRVSRLPPYPYRAFTFTNGPVFAGAEAIDPDSIRGLQPLSETKRGESPATAMARWLIAQDIAEGFRPPVHIVEAHGRAGTKLTGLSRGSGPYANGLMLWRKGTEFSEHYGLSGIWCPCIHMDQGEADRDKTGRSQYNILWHEFRDLVEADMRAITGQKEPVWLVIAQLASAAGELTSGAGAWTALSQFDLMLKEPRTTIAMPSYFFKKEYGMLGVHFKPLGHALRGEYQAKAALTVRRAIQNKLASGGDPWGLTIHDVRTCLRPDLDHVLREGVLVKIPLILPEVGSNVVLDTITLPPADYFGFSLVQNTSNSIVQVNLNGTVIEVRLKHAEPVILRYAFDNSKNTESDRSGAWGNFRDDCNSDSLAVAGTKLWNWLICFDCSIP